MKRSEIALRCLGGLLSVFVPCMSPVYAQRDPAETPAATRRAPITPAPNSTAAAVAISPDTTPTVVGSPTLCSLEMFPDALSGRILLGIAASAGTPSDLWVLDLDQRRLTPIAQQIGANSFAGFSPDGTQIGFTSRSDAGKVAMKADWDGSNAVGLIGAHDGLIGDWEYGDWVSDKILLFNAEGKIAIVPATERDVAQPVSTPSTPTKASVANAVRPITVPGRLSEARLSPDRTSILFATSKFWPGIDSCIRTIASSVDSCPLAGSLSFTRARWNRSGELIAYTVGDDGSASVGIFNRKAKTRSTLAEGDQRCFDPVWNPNNEQVAYINESEGVFTLYLKEAGKAAIPLTTCHQPVRLFDWSPTKTIEVEALRVKRSGGGM